MPAFFSTDLLVVLLFVLGIGVYALRSAKLRFTIEEYFFADKDLTWPIIGITIIASNISTEHFVGQAGEGYKVGLAVASYEWTAALVMMFVAYFVLPKFLRAGIHTLPEFLEYRYNKYTRLLMSIVVVLLYTWAFLPAVIYLGAVTLDGIFNINIYLVIWFIGIISGIFAVSGGFKSIIKANIIFGILILIGGAALTTLGFIKLGGISEFATINPYKLRSLLPASDKHLPWTSVFLGGLWILHINYWCANQFILQHSLASRTLSEGQKGILFAATIKLIIPLLIIVPGIMGYDFFGEKYMNSTNQVYLHLVELLLPDGTKGILLAILIGAAISTLHSQVHAASSIFSLDIFQRFIDTKATDKKIVTVGRLFAIAAIIFGCVRASFLSQNGGDDFYESIQTYWGYIAPSLAIVFLFGVISKKSPAISANVIMILNPIIYEVLRRTLTDSQGWTMLDRIFYTSSILTSIYFVLYLIFPRKTELEMPEAHPEIKFERNLVVFIWMIFIISALSALYIIFM